MYLGACLSFMPFYVPDSNVTLCKSQGPTPLTCEVSNGHFFMKFCI